MSTRIVIVLVSMAFLTVSCKKVENVFDGIRNQFSTDNEYYSNEHLSISYPITYMNSTEGEDDYVLEENNFLTLVKFSDFFNKEIMYLRLTT